MLELMFCAFFTILPDFLIKRFVFKKRWGREITFFTMWYELRWGITA
ncbi:MAG: HlyD family secretion protein, partial [Desulfocapsaceae bacterium]